MEKPGRKTTEFWAMLGVLVYGALGVTPEQIDVSSTDWVNTVIKTVTGVAGGGNIKLLILGGLVWIYTKYRADIKKHAAEMKADVYKTKMFTNEGSDPDG